MTSWKSRIVNSDGATIEESDAAKARPEVIGEIRVKLYGWKAGQSQVQIAFPQEARAGGAHAGALQKKFVEHAMSEISDNAHLLMRMGA